MVRQLLLVVFLAMAAMPSWADYVIGTCTIRVPISASPAQWWSDKEG
jgi:hypothetical protein